MKLPQLASSLLVVALCAAAPARAQSAPNADASAAASTPLSLNLQLGHSTLDAEAIQKAIELELKRPIVLALPSATATQSLSVTAHPNHTVTVSYRAANGLIRTRSIGVPQDPARAAEVIALLSGNLSRDEAAELLADLAAKSAPAAASATPANGTSAQADATAPNEPTAPATPAPEKAERAKAEPASAPLGPPSIPRHVPRSTPPLLLTAPAFNLSLYAPLALFRNGERRRLNVELGLLFSRVGELDGAGLNAVAFSTEGDVHGTSFATFYNRTGGTVYGASAAAFVNRSARVQGVELSGIVNLGSSEVRGLSVAGVANFEHDFQGLQLAGAFNQATRLQGLQAAGVLNQADDIRGLQLGLVNIAGEVHGMQVGVVNVAKHVDGTSIGLVSVAGNGRLQPVLWASTLLPFNAAMKFTIGSFYTQAGLGYAPDNHTYTYELGLGAHFQTGRFFLEPGVHYSEMRDTRRAFRQELIEHGHYRLSAGLDLGAASPFLGFALLQRFAHSANAPASDAVTAEGFAGVACF